MLEMSALQNLHSAKCSGNALLLQQTLEFSAPTYLVRDYVEDV
jgi:hypothetical protein